MRARTYFVYILASVGGVLYSGVTRDLRRRVFEHRSGLVPGSTTRYKVYKLVWWEHAEAPEAAIAREKQIKSWRRSKRVALIDESNPGWHDLAEYWFR